MNAPLSYEVFVSEGRERAGDRRMPNGDRIRWSPLSTTLIHGREDAILVDPPFIDDQVQAVADWVERSGKRLTHVFATHGHGDHWFGTAELLKRFPDAKAYAVEGAIDLMHQQATVGREQLWDIIFPGQIPASPVVYEPFPAEGLLLEGNLLQAIAVGHSDTDDTAVLHVPSIGLVVAGDVAYNGVHQYILEGKNGGLEQWLKALDKVAALEPAAVVAGHKNKALPDDPAIIGQTQDYLRNVIRLLDEKTTAKEFFEEMTTLYPDRLNQGPVWYGALGLLGA
jgi:glyoxylase-like metal-dependent hydrolase (beta-lactamase superfamily II)